MNLIVQHVKASTSCLCAQSSFYIVTRLPLWIRAGSSERAIKLLWYLLQWLQRERHSRFLAKNKHNKPFSSRYTHKSKSVVIGQIIWIFRSILNLKRAYEINENKRGFIERKQNPSSPYPVILMGHLFAKLQEHNRAMVPRTVTRVKGVTFKSPPHIQMSLLLVFPAVIPQPL